MSRARTLSPFLIFWIRFTILTIEISGVVSLNLNLKSVAARGGSAATRVVEQDDNLSLEQERLEELEPVAKLTLARPPQEANVRCAVCLEDFLEEDEEPPEDAEHATQDIVRVRCGHFYHLPCIQTWLDRPECVNCPQCRQPLRTRATVDNLIRAVGETNADHVNYFQFSSFFQNSKSLSCEMKLLIKF